MSPLARCSWLVFALHVISGCSADEPASARPTRSIEYELFPSTHQLGSAELATLREVSADGVLRFEAPTSSLQELTVGQVLMAGVSDKTPRGLLRLVLAVEHDDSGALVLRTAAAPLQLAFKKLHARIVDSSAPFAEGSRLLPALGEKARIPREALGGDIGDHQSYQIVVFDGDDSLDTTNDQVLIDASLGGGFEFDLSIDVDWGAVEELPTVVTECVTSVADVVLKGELPKCSIERLMPELKLSLEVKPYLDAEVKVHGAASVGFSEELTVGTIVLPPFTIGPLVIEPSAEIVATIEGSASARFSASAHANIKTRSKVVLSSKVENSKIVPFEVEEVDADAETPEIDLYAEARAKPGVRLTLALYGVLGPYAQVSAVAALLADPLANPCWDLRVGLEAQLGVVVKTPALPVVGSLTFLDWNTGPLSLFEESVADGTCDISEEGMRMPPGGGPTAVALQMPPFTPWSRLLGAPADGSDLASLFAFPTGFPFLTPSIDGRYLAGGGGAEGLLKLDEQGNTVWRSQLLGSDGRALRSLGSVPSGDAGLVTLYRPRDASTFVLAKQTQSGVLERAFAYELPEECGPTVQAIARDAGSGFVVLGECAFLQSAWLVHLDAQLAVTRSVRIQDGSSATVRLTPTALTRAEGELIITGNLVRTGESAGPLAFVLRMDDQDLPRLASAYACPARLGLYPSAVIPSSAGNITLVGDAGGAGYVLRLQSDGSLGFVHFPSLGGGIQSGFAPNSVVELPTTGLVIAATVSGANDTPPDLIVMGLDGNGRTQWGREYTLHDGPTLRALGWPSARLTDDGGVLITATAGAAGASDELLGMKVYARDGTLADSALISSAAIMPEDRDYPVEQRSLTVESTAIEVPRRPFEGTSQLQR